MKNLTHLFISGILAILLLVPTYAFTQEGPPTKEELEKMMKELDPETIEMMKKMGIPIPNLDQLNTAFSGNFEDTPIFPKRDEIRIAQAKKTSVKAAEMPGYLIKVQTSVGSKLGSKAVENAKEIIAMANSTAELAQIANGLWMTGATAYGLLVMGEVVRKEPQNPDYLNNYSAFLTMAGAEEAALPILKQLNSAFPKNSTILNNLAQAWFGLGDIPTTEAYLDSTLALYPGHSQANLTKSVIEEEKGNKTEAAKALKESIKSGYSKEKENRINNLGHKVTSNDLTFTPPLNEDPLGLVHMNWPKYPQSVNESEFLKKEWEDYRESIRILSQPLEEHLDRLGEEYEALMENPMERLGSLNREKPVLQLINSSKYQALRDYYKGDEELEYKQYLEMVESQNKLTEATYLIEEKYEKRIAELVKTLKGPGEGSTEAEMVAYCQAINSLNSQYLMEINTFLESENKKMIDYWRRTLSERMNYNQFTMLPEEFEMELLKTKLMWLGFISGQEVRFSASCPYAEIEEEGPEFGELKDFYDMTCKQKSVLNLVVGSITIECNKMTTQLDSKFFKYTVKENMDTDRIIKGSVEIGLDANLVEAAELGPVKAELKGEIYGFVEFGESGVSDFGLKGGVKASFGSNAVDDDMVKGSLGFADDPSITILGADARWGWNSGPSLEGKSILQGLSTLKN